MRTSPRATSFRAQPMPPMPMPRRKGVRGGMPRPIREPTRKVSVSERSSRVCWAICFLQPLGITNDSESLAARFAEGCVCWVLDFAEEADSLFQWRSSGDAWRTYLGRSLGRQHVEKHHDHDRDYEHCQEGEFD